MTLKDEYPMASHLFEGSGFSVQISPLNAIGRIPVDKAVEETVNKDV